MPEGRASPSAEVTLIVKRPEVGCGVPLGLPGVGVVERPISPSAPRAPAAGFGDFFPSFQDIVCSSNSGGSRCDGVLYYRAAKYYYYETCSEYENAYVCVLN